MGVGDTPDIDEVLHRLDDLAALRLQDPPPKWLPPNDWCGPISALCRDASILIRAAVLRDKTFEPPPKSADRAYTLAEIDRMRAALFERAYRAKSRSYSLHLDHEDRRRLEGQLRTYLGRGIDPDELEASASDAKYEGEVTLDVPSH